MYHTGSISGNQMAGCKGQSSSPCKSTKGTWIFLWPEVYSTTWGSLEYVVGLGQIYYYELEVGGTDGQSNSLLSSSQKAALSLPPPTHFIRLVLVAQD